MLDFTATRCTISVMREPYFLILILGLVTVACAVPLNAGLSDLLEARAGIPSAEVILTTKTVLAS
ncbi:hypothetical protein BT96DRAFT_996835 [Gymnopus androsaceus JB14]|uniref:Uncharacterized protein n=1 Tax=Gymnopus androsaceus JB14 TaxID=1447944 RepID=A0A6A4HGU0_9AGAR|nr:hypothetical protein BT96DRAFT_996835 [Gymnopus androsaceus JB14]